MYKKQNENSIAFVECSNVLTKSLKVFAEKLKLPAQ
jgi:hypothetical protein